MNDSMESEKHSNQILLVEDEPLLSTLLKQRLEKEGYQVVGVTDGEEALSAIRRETPRLILLDIILPKMSGFEFMERVNDDPQIPAIPIVITSNLGQETDIERGRKLGAVGYFVKARVSIEDLIEQIKEYLGDIANGIRAGMV